MLMSLVRKLIAHKWLWLYGAVVLFAVIALAFTTGMSVALPASFNDWMYSPNLWPFYIFVEPDLYGFNPDIAGSATPIAFTFDYFEHFAPIQISAWAFALTVLYWIAVAFVVVTLTAAVCGGLRLRRRKLVLGIDVAIVILFIVYLCYADYRILAFPAARRFDMLAIALSMLALWALTVVQGHRPPFLGLGRHKKYVALAAVAAAACISFVAYYDSGVIHSLDSGAFRFTSANIKVLSWSFVASVWALLTVWLLVELRRRIHFKVRAVLPYLFMFLVVVLLALFVGSQSVTVFGQPDVVLIRVLWLPHFNINDLIRLPANDLVNTFLIDDNWLHPAGSLLSGWNAVSLLFTLIWWAVLARIFTALGMQVVRQAKGENSDSAISSVI